MKSDEYKLYMKYKTCRDMYTTQIYTRGYICGVGEGAGEGAIAPSQKVNNTFLLNIEFNNYILYQERYR